MPEGDAEPNTALRSFHHALSISPLDPTAYRAYVGLAHCHIGHNQNKEAQAWASRAVGSNERSPAALRALTVALALDGEIDEAEATATRLLALYPDSIERYRHWTPFRHAPLHLELMIEGLRIAGFPETSDSLGTEDTSMAFRPA